MPNEQEAEDLKKYGFEWVRGADPSLDATDHPEPDDLNLYVHSDGTKLYISQDENQWSLLDKNNRRIDRGEILNGSLDLKLDKLFR